MSDSEYVSIDKIELKRLQADSEELSKLRAHPAALAPAAVAVVMPEPLHVPTVHGYSRAFGEGYNECLEEVARLNRRALPAGLLERVAKPGYTEVAKRELRALLGKS